MMHSSASMETRKRAVRFEPAPRTPEQKAFVSAFEFEDPGAPRLAQLLERYALDAVIAPGCGELEKLRLLSDWTYERFRMFGRPSAKTEDALEILEHCAAGHTFYCAHYAIVMCAAATALGWHARVISLRRADYPGRVSNHNIVELWSVEYAKWVLWDPTLNYSLERRGVPLNAYEAARAWFRDDGADVDILVGPLAKRYAKEDLPLEYRHYPNFGWQKLCERGMSSFACLAYVPTNRLLGAYPGRTIEHWADWPGIHVIETAKEPAWSEQAEILAPYYPVIGRES